MKVGDLVVSARGLWHTPRLVVETHKTAKELIGVLWPDGETKYVHRKHLKVISSCHSLDTKKLDVTASRCYIYRVRRRNQWLA